MEVSASDILYTVLAVFAVVGVFFAIGWLFSEDISPDDDDDEESEDDGDESDPVDHPDHYNNHPSGIECIDIVKFHSFCIGNAIKYIWRHGEKGRPVEDLKKAIWYLEKQIELYEDKESGR